MSKLKNKVINEIIRIEGGYSNDPRDSGGETKFGITEKVAREWGYPGEMINLSVHVAFKIYSSKYWDPLKLDTIEALSPGVAEEMVDTGVNQGISRAAKFLQRALTLFNNRGKIYDDLIVDGDIGEKTVRALGDYLAYRGDEGEVILLRALNALQGSFYIDLAERREKDESFVYGWFKNRVVM